MPAIADAPTTPQALGRIFNVGADVPYTVNHLADVVRRAMGVPDHPIEHLTARNEVKHAFSDHSKMLEVFGRSAETDLETGIGRMVEWAKKHGPRKTAKFSNIEILRNLPPSWLE